MSTGGVCLIRHEILFRNVGDVGDVLGFCEDMVVGLIFARSDLGGNREPPFLGVIEKRIDIEDHPAKGPIAMFHDLTDSEFRFSHDRPADSPFIARQPPGASTSG